MSLQLNIVCYCSLDDIKAKEKTEGENDITKPTCTGAVDDLDTGAVDDLDNKVLTLADTPEATHTGDADSIQDGINLSTSGSWQNSFMSYIDKPTMDNKMLDKPTTDNKASVKPTTDNSKKLNSVPQSEDIPSNKKDGQESTNNRSKSTKEMKTAESNSKDVSDGSSNDMKEGTDSPASTKDTEPTDNKQTTKSDAAPPVYRQRRSSDRIMYHDGKIWNIGKGSVTSLTLSDVGKSKGSSPRKKQQVIMSVKQKPEEVISVKRKTVDNGEKPKEKDNQYTAVTLDMINNKKMRKDSAGNSKWTLEKKEKKGVKRSEKIYDIAFKKKRKV